MKKNISFALCKRGLAFLLIFALLANTAFAATFTVNDSGDASDAAPGNGACATAGAVCTLRAAIEESNALAGTDTINFSAASRTLTPASTMTVSSNLTIDGSSAGFPNTIALDGNDGAYSALTLGDDSDGSTIKGLFIYDFGSSGITITGGANSVTIGSTTMGQGNFIGLRTDGSTADGNTGKGITSAGTNVSILGNYIGSNTGPGIGLTDGSKDVTIKLNTIGSAMGSDTARGNAKGIDIDSTTSLNGGDAGVEGIVIGGDADTEGNVIVSSSNDGIHIGNGAGTVSGTVKIKGNKIGIGAQGASMANSDGIEAETDATGLDIIIGPEAADDATEANEIGANSSNGIKVTEADDLVIAGNFIGLDNDGVAKGNSAAGVQVGNGAVGPNTVLIGSDNADSAEINAIGNNGTGGVIIDNATTINIAGNYIGFNGSGAGSHGNTGAGVAIGGTQATSITVGGTGASAAARNFIGNSLGASGRGLSLTSSANAASVAIKATIIGLAADLNTAAGNAQAGIYLTAAANYIIGSNGDSTDDSTEYNVVSSNAADGIYVGNGPLTANISGNYVGLGSSNGGTTFATSKGNGTNGIKIASNSLTALTIGGALAAQRNVIGSSSEDGINITDAGEAIACTLQNNYVGVASDGSTSRANSGAGMDIDDCGAITLTDNVVSNNAVHGIDIGAGTSLTARGNKIGAIATGLAAAGNSGSGLLISAVTMASVIIGGSTAGQGNVITSQITGANNGYGINIANLAANNTPVSFLGNYIGIGGDGTTTTGMDNDHEGIRATKGAITVGGDNDLASGNLAGGNVISNNGQNGIIVTNNASSASIYGNIIGLKKNGGGIYNTAAGNARHGVVIDNGSAASPLLIGAANGTTVASRRNIISSNGTAGAGYDYGVYIQAPGGPGGDGPATVKIQNNYIGTDITGAVALGNLNSGIRVERGSNVTIGSDLDGTNDLNEANLISGNGVGSGGGPEPAAGITLTDTISSIGIYGNTIGLNAAKTAALKNYAGGIVIDGLLAAATINVGSTISGGRNYISGNGELGGGASSGIYVGSTNAAGVILNIVNNWIGYTDSSVPSFAVLGTKLLASIDMSGAVLGSPSNLIAAAAAGATAISNSNGGIYLNGSNVTTTIGDGTTAGRNIISGNTGGGVLVFGGNVTINNNLIGTDANSESLPNTSYGVYANNMSGGISYLKISSNIINTLSSGVTGVLLMNVIPWNETNGNLTTDNTWTGRATGSGQAYWWQRYVGIALTAYGPKACYDGRDNDASPDSLSDYPADPGCSSVEDNDEYNDQGGAFVSAAVASPSRNNSADSSSAAKAADSNKAADSGAAEVVESNANAVAKDDVGGGGAVVEDLPELIEKQPVDEQAVIDQKLLEDQAVRKYIVHQKLAEAVNTTTDVILGRDRINLELLLTEIEDVSEIAGVDEEIAIERTPDQILVSDALDKVASGEKLADEETARVDRAVEAVVVQSVQRLFEEINTSGTSEIESDKDSAVPVVEEKIPEVRVADNDRVDDVGAFVPVRVANGQIKKIRPDTRIEFVSDGRKAADLQDIADVELQNNVYLTSYTTIDESPASAMVEISNGGVVGDRLSGEKIFFRGLNGLSDKITSVEELIPDKPLVTNLVDGVEIGAKFVLWIAGPEGQKFTVFAVDKSENDIESIDPEKWKISELGTVEAGKGGKAQLEVDFSEIMVGDKKEFDIVIQDENGKGTVVPGVTVNRLIETKMDSVMLRDGKEVIPADLTDSSDLNRKLRTTVLLASETVKQEENPDDRMVLTGYAEPGSVVFVTWESIVMTSAVIADASQGYFEVEVPKQLAKGEHKALTYSYNKPRKTASSYSKVLFKKRF